MHGLPAHSQGEHESNFAYVVEAVSHLVQSGQQAGRKHELSHVSDLLCITVSTFNEDLSGVVTRVSVPWFHQLHGFLALVFVLNCS